MKLPPFPATVIICYRYRYNQSLGSFDCTYITFVTTLRYIKQIKKNRPSVSLLHKQATLHSPSLF